MKILITAPSLIETENVSGISALVRQIVGLMDAEFIHFRTGRKDQTGTGLRWLADQIVIAPAFALLTLRTKPALVHINTAMTKRAILRDFALVLTARIVGTPVLLHVHGGEYFSSGFPSKIYESVVGKMLRYSGAVIVTGEREREFLRKLGNRILISVLPNAVAVSDIPQRNFHRSPLRFLFFGRLHRDKGLIEIIEACKTLREDGLDIQFNCFGAGEDLEKFRGEMREVLGDRFFYGGVAAEEQKHKIFCENDLFILPSYYEGLPVSLLEAMASGLVPIASDVGSVGSVVINDHNGFLIAAKNANSLSKAMRKAFNEKGKLADLSKNAHKTVKERYNIDDFVKKLREIYSGFGDGKL